MLLFSFIFDVFYEGLIEMNKDLFINNETTKEELINEIERLLERSTELNVIFGDLYSSATVQMSEDNVLCIDVMLTIKDYTMAVSEQMHASMFDAPNKSFESYAMLHILSTRISILEKMGFILVDVWSGHTDPPVTDYIYRKENVNKEELADIILKLVGEFKKSVRGIGFIAEFYHHLMTLEYGECNYQPILEKLEQLSGKKRKLFGAFCQAFIDDIKRGLDDERIGWRTKRKIAKMAGISNQYIYKHKLCEALHRNEMLESRLYKGPGARGDTREFRIKYANRHDIEQIFSQILEIHEGFQKK